MKLILSTLMLFCTVSAHASFSDVASDLAEIFRNAGDAKTGYIVPGDRGGGRNPPRYPDPGRNPGRPGRPDPGRPPGGGGRLTCVAQDTGWEEHRGAHYSCNECLRAHDSCNETCSQVYTECRAEGTDRNNRLTSFYGRADSRYRAEDEALYSCRNYAYNCRVVSCEDKNDVVSRRSCR